MKQRIFASLVIGLIGIVLCRPIYAAVTAGNHTSKGGLFSVTTTGITTTNATLIVACITSDSSSTAFTLNDSNTNSWTPLTLRSGAPPVVKAFYVSSPSTGTGHTFTAASCVGCGIAVSAFFGTRTATTPFDQENGQGSSGSITSLATNAVVPTVNNEVVVTCLATNSAISSTTIDTGGTILENLAYVGGTNYGIAMSYHVQTTATSENTTWSWSGASVGGATMAATFFEPAAGGGGCTLHPMALLGVGKC